MQTGLIFNLQPGTNRSSSQTRTRTGASNLQGSGRVGARVRCKTERGDRGDRKGVLTCEGEERERPALAVNAGGSSVWCRSGGAPVRGRAAAASFARRAGRAASRRGRGSALLWGRGPPGSACRARTPEMRRRAAQQHRLGPDGLRVGRGRASGGRRVAGSGLRARPSYIG
jgi:hypothetical protein